ncbi:hypothetical protein [Jonesia denitrificans]|uniref:Head-to-tail adaptor n=1 Tax=Jonesia denitrificans (strain ATCC 14870 / DSM 20603 / BCRC 15368 / CIP 55.134 / JCM 11481 / NBRC 15587 / NCTC 10816 / Prevot 55134) TaxID=471856 RepID=C7R1H2_JONDD|nr:hypothetical protein [Jonesia denitrificans]ACV09807.1 hypothetical protein Jden_2170 [Jonesia denitrificans DSM 20603]ASE08993.1 hypothetical protein CEP80_07485 [Jonesia denitrificans]QXB43539.1 hypothetical protein I6L70_01135 [Jonesia denitrificans]SQH22447.1 Uncharacterised protein [Jonesia denitrificans]
MAYATTDDLQDFLGNEWEVASDSTRATRLLRMASGLVDAEAGRSWVPGEVPDQIVDVVCAVAGRGFTNPGAQKSEQLDDYSSSSVVSEAGLYLTDSELRIVARLAKPRFGGLGTVATERGDIRTKSDDQAWWVNGPNGWVD